MHFIHQELARGRQDDLLREAEKHRLALSAREPRERGQLTWFLTQIRRRRPQQRPAPAV